MTKQQLKNLILECLNEINNINEDIITQIRGHDIEEVAEEMKRTIEYFCKYEMTPLYKINNIGDLSYANKKFFRDMENQVQIVLNKKNLSNIQFQIDRFKDGGQLIPIGERKYVLNISINYFLIHPRDRFNSKPKKFNDIDFSDIRETLVHELMHAEQFERITTKGRIRTNYSYFKNSYFEKTSEPLVKLFEGILNRYQVYDIFRKLLRDVFYLNKDLEKMTWSRKIVATSIKQLIKTPKARSITTPEQIKQYVLNNINKIAQNAILNLEERLLYNLKQDLNNFKYHNDDHQLYVFYNEEIYIKIENQLKSIKDKKLVYLLLPFQHYLKNIYNYANNINYGIFNRFFKIKADYDAEQKNKDEEEELIKQWGETEMEIPAWLDVEITGKEK